MTAKHQDFHVYARTYREVSFELDPDNLPSLGGATAEWWMGLTPQSVGADVKIKKSTALTGDNLLTLVQESGVWKMKFGVFPTDTSLIAPAGIVKYYHQGKIIESNGKPHIVVTGEFELRPSMGV